MKIMKRVMPGRYLFFFATIALGFLVLLSLHKKPLLGNAAIVFYLLYLASIERKDTAAKAVIYSLILLSGLLFYGYYFV